MNTKTRERLPGERPNRDARAEANQEVDRSLRYAQIIEILEGKGPLTAKEVAVEMYLLGESPSSERNFSAPRLTELTERGVVEPIGKRQCQYTSKTVTVYGLIEDEERLSLFREYEKIAARESRKR